MPEHGTASISGAYIEFQSAVLKALPRGITDELALKWAGEGERLTRMFSVLAQLPMAETNKTKKPTLTLPQYPPDSEVFELTIDGDAPENDPIEMVRCDGYGSPEKWKFTGQKVAGIQTRAFKLVRVGVCRNLKKVRQRLAQYGDIPEGQWRQAFKAAYPQPDGNGPIGIADSSWVDPDGGAGFPCVDSGGGSDFRWADDGRGGGWRWLVPASK